MIDDINSLINHAHQDIEYGTVTVFIKKHMGKVANIDSNKYFTHKVEDSKQALQIVATLLKGAKAAEDNSSITFTIEIHKGESNKVIVQDTKKYRVM